MDPLHMDLIESEASLHKDMFFSKDWNVFSGSILWMKIKRSMNYIEREHFKNCWEAA